MLDYTSITDCLFPYSTWESANLQGSRWEDTHFPYAFFRGSVWTGAVMSDQKFDNANFGKQPR